jgi:hypothetical protein
MRTRRLLTPTVLAIAAALTNPVPIGAIDASATTAAAKSAAEITINPATLPRGENPAVPQLFGTTILDNDVRIEMHAQEVQLLGRSEDEYVVGVWRRDGSDSVLRVAPDGSRQELMGRIVGDLDLSQDGQQVFETVVRPDATSVVTVRDAHTGDRLARRTFRGYDRVLDADDGRAILGGGSPSRTFRWNFGTGATSKIVDREGYFADIRADRLAVLTADPYLDGGCSVVTALSAPHRPLWRSCRQAVTASTPNGRRLLTVYIAQDGPVAKLSVHAIHGRLLASYRAPAWFGIGTWETNREVLIPTTGTKETAIVRCRLDTCERATERIDSPADA